MTVPPGARYYRRVPSANRSYAGHPLLQGAGAVYNLSLRAMGGNANTAPEQFRRGLGTWAPMSMEYDLAALRAQARYGTEQYDHRIYY
jgi:hypothetical protein